MQIGAGTIQLGASDLRNYFEGNVYANGFTDVTVSGGTLKYASHGALGTGTVTMAGSTTLIQIRVEGRYINNEDVANRFVLSGGSVNVPLSFGGRKDIWLSGVVSGSGGWTVSGDTRSFTLSGDNTFSGGMVLENGTAHIQIAHVNALGTGALTVNKMGSHNRGLRAVSDLTAGVGVTNAVSIASGATFNVGGQNDLQLSGVISGTNGILNKIDDSTLILSGVNTYAGGTVVNVGTLTIDGSLADADMTIDDGTVDGSGTLNFNIDGATSDLIDMGSGALDISGLHVIINPIGAGLTEPVYVLVDYADGGTLTGIEFASVTGTAGYVMDYDYLGNGNQIALVARQATSTMLIIR